MQDSLLPELLLIRALFSSLFQVLVDGAEKLLSEICSDVEVIGIIKSSIIAKHTLEVEGVNGIREFEKIETNLFFYRSS